MELVLTYNVPTLSFIPETKTDVHVRHGYVMLSTWSHLPFIKRGLLRTREMMISSGISVEYDSSQIDLDCPPLTLQDPI
jgi:hypothetical protein